MRLALFWFLPLAMVWSAGCTSKTKIADVEGVECVASCYWCYEHQIICGRSLKAQGVKDDRKHDIPGSKTQPAIRLELPD